MFSEDCLPRGYAVCSLNSRPAARNDRFFVRVPTVPDSGCGAWNRFVAGAKTPAERQVDLEGVTRYFAISSYYLVCTKK